MRLGSSVKFKTSASPFSYSAGLEDELCDTDLYEDTFAGGKHLARLRARAPSTKLRDGILHTTLLKINSPFLLIKFIRWYTEDTQFWVELGSAPHLPGHQDLSGRLNTSGGKHIGFSVY